MSKRNFWWSMEWLLTSQRLFCASPFHLDRSRSDLNVSSFTNLYTILVLLIFSVLIPVAQVHFDCIPSVIVWFPQGYLWKMLVGYEIFSLHLHFALNILIANSTKWQQIDFLRKMAKFDSDIFSEIKRSVDFGRYRRTAMTVMVLFGVYHLALMVGVCCWAFGCREFSVAFFLAVYQTEQMFLAVTSLTRMNYILLLRDRYKLLRQINRLLKNDVLKCEGVNSKMIFLNKFSLHFGHFIELSKMVEHVDNVFGWNYILELIQEFTLSLIHSYFVIHIVFEESYSGRKVIYIAGVAVWSIGHFAKMFLSNIVNMTTEQVRFRRQREKGIGIISNWK